MSAQSLAGSSKAGRAGLGCCGGLASLLAWILEDFKMRHLVLQL